MARTLDVRTLIAKTLGITHKEQSLCSADCVVHADDSLIGVRLTEGDLHIDRCLATFTQVGLEGSIGHFIIDQSIYENILHKRYVCFYYLHHGEFTRLLDEPHDVFEYFLMKLTKNRTDFIVRTVVPLKGSYS